MIKRNVINITENSISAPFKAKDGSLSIEGEKILSIINKEVDRSGARKKIHANETSKNVIVTLIKLTDTLWLILNLYFLYNLPLANDDTKNKPWTRPHTKNVHESPCQIPAINIVINVAIM